MPRAGYVGMRLTPQRKLTIGELMRSEGFKKPSEALDFAIALAQDTIKTDVEEIEEVTSVPDFLNYYVGASAEGDLTNTEIASPLAKREQAEAEAANAEGFTAATHHAKLNAIAWRANALSAIRNYEPTITNLADAVDFALMTSLVHLRSGSVSDERKSEIKAEVRANAVQFKEVVTEFRSDNMNDKRATNEANDYSGKEIEKKRRKKATSPKSQAMIALANLKHTGDVPTGCDACDLLAMIDKKFDTRDFHNRNKGANVRFFKKDGTFMTDAEVKEQNERFRKETELPF